jgi:hypothetical protein
MAIYLDIHSYNHSCYKFTTSLLTVLDLFYQAFSSLYLSLISLSDPLLSVSSANHLLREFFADWGENTLNGWVYPFTKTPPLTLNVLQLVAYVCVVVWTCLIATQTMIQETWLPSRCLVMDGHSDSDIPAFRGTPQYNRGQKYAVLWTCLIFAFTMKPVDKYGLWS